MAELVQKEVVVFDIETISNCFTYTALEPVKGTISQFVIHQSRNDLRALISHLNGLRIQIGFNCLSFDSQVINFILENYHEWGDLNGEEISYGIYQYAQYIINLTNNGGFPPFPEWKLKIPCIDLFKIWHFDNKNKMTSLKWIEFMIDWPHVQEMPVKHYDKVTSEQIPGILEYNKNDVLSTYELWKITRGNTDHPLYKGVDKIALRQDIQAEFGIPCINYNDVKIGDALNKLNYCRIKGIDKKHLPKSNKEVQEFTFGDCFPEYMKFETTEFNNFVHILKNIKVKLKK